MKHSAPGFVFLLIFAFSPVFSHLVPGQVKKKAETPLYQQELYNRLSCPAAFARKVMKTLTRAEDRKEKKRAEGSAVVRDIFIPGGNHFLGCRVLKTELGGIECYEIHPKRTTSEKVILYFHGGGYVDGPIRLEWNMAARMAEESGCKVFLLIYRLAPENKFPAGLEDCHRAYLALSQKIPASNIRLMGDSAGGGMVLALCLKLRDLGQPLPSSQILISPWLDVGSENPEISKVEPFDPMLNYQELKNTGRIYADSSELKNPYVSPLYGNLKGLPPTLLLMGTYDILCPDADLFAEKAGKILDDFFYIRAEKQIHVWPAGIGFFPEARRAIRQMADFIRRY